MSLLEQHFIIGIFTTSLIAIFIVFMILLYRGVYSILTYLFGTNINLQYIDKNQKHHHLRIRIKKAIR